MATKIVGLALRSTHFAAKYGGRYPSRRPASPTMTANEPPVVSARWPHLAAELVTALREEGESGLADRIDTLHLRHKRTRRRVGLRRTLLSAMMSMGLRAMRRLSIHIVLLSTRR